MLKSYPDIGNHVSFKLVVEHIGDTYPVDSLPYLPEKYINILTDFRLIDLFNDSVLEYSDSEVLLHNLYPVLNDGEFKTYRIKNKRNIIIRLLIEGKVVDEYLNYKYLRNICAQKTYRILPYRVPYMVHLINKMNLNESSLCNFDMLHKFKDEGLIELQLNSIILLSNVKLVELNEDVPLHIFLATLNYVFNEL